jgi:hypothetical protein
MHCLQLWRRKEKRSKESRAEGTKRAGLQDRARSIRVGTERTGKTGGVVLVGTLQRKRQARRDFRPDYRAGEWRHTARQSEQMEAPVPFVTSESKMKEITDKSPLNLRNELKNRTAKTARQANAGARGRGEKIERAQRTRNTS